MQGIPTFDYMALAKSLEHAPGYFLAGSTMAMPSKEEAGWTDNDFSIDSLFANYGDCRAIDALSQRFGVPADEISITCGSSEANALLYRILLEPGDEVLAETPGYEVFHKLPALSGARYVPLPRRPELGFQIDLAEYQRLLSPKTRLVVLTDLHNPSMAKIPATDLRKMIELAAEVGAYVLVDEVYLDHLLPGSHDATCYHYGSGTFRNVIVTSSLTKVYGLGVMRFGWCFAPPELTARMIDLIDLTTVAMPVIAQNLGTRALLNLDRLRPRARQRHERGRPILERWIASQVGRIQWQGADGGITAFVKVRDCSDSARLCENLVRRHGVVVTPGEAFQVPGWLRVNFAGEPAWLELALNALGEGIQAELARG